MTTTQTPDIAHLRDTAMQRDEPDAAARGPDSPATDVADASIAALFSRVIDDGERFVAAGLRLYRARLLTRLSAARWAAMLLLGALFLAQSTVVALLVGLVLALRQALGIIGATAAVTGGALAVAMLLVAVAVSQLRRATAIDPAHDPDGAAP